VACRGWNRARTPSSRTTSPRSVRTCADRESCSDSRGAVIAYRLARALGAGWPSGVALVLSAPPDGFPDWHLLPDPELIEIARGFGLVPAAIDDDTLTRFVLPPLRFDLQSISGGWGPLAPIGGPTHVMTGREDVKLSRPAVERLAADVGAGGVLEVAGPHMFVCTNPDDTARELVRIAETMEHPCETGR